MIAIGVLIALSATAGLAAYQSFAYRLPDPASADREGLFRWLVLADLEEEPHEVREQLITRLKEELRAGVELSRVEAEISAERRARFWQNVDLLLRDWAFGLADRFGELPEGERATFVRTTIDDLLTWEFVRAQRAADAGGGDTALLAECERRIDQWRETATPEQAERLDQLLMLAKADLMLRYWQGEL